MHLNKEIFPAAQDSLASEQGAFHPIKVPEIYTKMSRQQSVQNQCPFPSWSKAKCMHAKTHTKQAQDQQTFLKRQQQPSDASDLEKVHETAEPTAVLHNVYRLFN